MTRKTPALLVHNFAQIESAQIDFGDLTVLVGPQATGKSLVLQLWKLLQDRSEMMASLKAAGFDWTDDDEFIQHVLGQGWQSAWTQRTVVQSGSQVWTVAALRRRKGAEEGTVFYVPAQRTLVLDNGWPRQFQQFTPDTPYVVRQFSQTLHGVIGGYARSSTDSSPILFPHSKRLKAALKEKLDEAVFHGAQLTLSSVGMRWQLGLEYQKGSVKLGYMSWTTGQREVSPLLLSLYHLLPPGGATRREGVEWVVIEEPEMGLHPRAILAVVLVMLDLLSRGYRVIVSTHAPVLLDVIFAVRHLQQIDDEEIAIRRMLKAFDLKRNDPTKALCRDALGKTYKVFAFEYGADNRVRTSDISNLNPGSTNHLESGWGGLTGFSSHIANAAFMEDDY